MFRLPAAMMLCVCCATAFAEEPTLEKVTSVEGITEYRLSNNGLQVLLFPDDSKPKVTINITYFVGSRHEGYGEAGMAHLLEHMVFKGTPTYKDVPNELIGRGAQPINGTTWLDRTNYYEGLPASPENLEFGIKFESDRMINSFIAEKDLRSEMTVVRNEFEQGQNNPMMTLMEQMANTAFQWHNYGQTTIGNKADIERVPIENLQAFYRKYYQPDNAMLVVAGKFDEAKAKEHILKYFGAIPPPTRELPKTYTEEPAQEGERLVTVRRIGKVGWAGAMYHVPSGPHPESAAIAVLTDILVSEPSGRLYKKLVKTKRAASVVGTNFSLHDPGFAFFLAQGTPGSDAETILEAIMEVTESFADEPVTQKEVDRAIQSFQTGREKSNADSGQLAIDLSEWAAQGDWRLYYLHRDRMEKVTKEQVQTVAEKYLVRDNRTMGLFKPEKEVERVTVPPTPSIADMLKGYKGRAMIAKGEAFDPDLANIEERTNRTTLKSGIKAALLPKESRGKRVSMRLTLRYGDKKSLAGRVKAGKLLPAMLMRGTENMSRDEVRDAFSKIGAQVQIAGQPGVILVTVSAKRDNLGPALDLVRTVLREPAFDDKELDTLKSQQVAQFTANKAEPMALAQIEIRRTLSRYEKGDPRYVGTIDEEIEATKKVTSSDIRNLYDDLMNGQNGELTIVGDFNPEEAAKKIEAIAKDWNSNTKYVRMDRLSKFEIDGGLRMIRTPDKANAIFIGGTAFPMRSDNPDYPAMLIGNIIFGGDPFTSRLGARIRQKEGLSYGVGSQLNVSPYDESAMMMIFAISNPKNGAKLRTAMKEELTRMLADGVTQAEVDRAVKGYLDKQRAGRATDGSLATLLEQTTRTGRTTAFTAEVEAKIRALTAEQVSAALRKYLKPEKIAVIHAGDFPREEGE